MVVSSKRNYEECRRQRMEENKRKLEELNLKTLASSLTAASPKSTPVKQAKIRTPRKPLDVASVPVRRSSRFTDKPAPNYKEFQEIDPLLRVRRSYTRRDLFNRVYASDDIRAHAIDRAEQLQSTLDTETPSFVKPMLQSHVTGGFWLGLPVQFCKTHLPHHDEMITLVDEEEEEYATKYLSDKTGLSGGWRGFSIAHELVDGDALVFHLIKPTVFKVYIIRAYQSEEETKEEAHEEKENSDQTNIGKNAKRSRARKE